MGWKETGAIPGLPVIFLHLNVTNVNFSSILSEFVPVLLST